MKKFMIIMGCFVLFLALAGCDSNSDKDTKSNVNNEKEETKSNVNNEKEETKSNKNKKKEEIKYMTGKHKVKIEIEDFGDIEVELDADVAPITVTNYINLVKEGFYDGLTFHRIISGFMIQGGDPDGNGTGGSPNKIKGEFSANGVKNDISHKRGVISMARSQSYDSASSQFFIVHEDSTFLDGNYAAFGHVTSGMDVVDKICEKIEVEDENGTVLSKNQPKIKKITVID